MGWNVSGDGRVAALRWLCRAISPLVPHEEVVATKPVLDGWPAVVAAADGHMLLPSLKLAIERHNLGGDLDPELLLMMEGLFELHQARNSRLRQQVKTISCALNAAGVRPIWLKGSLSLLADDWRSSGRMMLDLDVWVPDSSDQVVALEVLDRLGYVMSTEEVWGDGFQHYPSHFHPDEIARIELHRRITDLRFEPLIIEREAFERVEWISWEGAQIGRLDALFRCLNSLLQSTLAAPSEFDVAQIPLMKGFDFVQRIHADFSGAIPDELVARVRHPRWVRSAQQFFTVLDSYFGLINPLPPDPRNRWAIEMRLTKSRFFRPFVFMNMIFSKRGLSVLRNPLKIPAAMEVLLRMKW